MRRVDLSRTPITEFGHVFLYTFELDSYRLDKSEREESRD